MCAISASRRTITTGSEKAGSADVTNLDYAKLNLLAKRKLQPAAIIGGPPCQSFSRAAHSSEDDHRHELPLEFARLLAEFNKRSPVSFFVFENVPGLLKDRHKERLRGIHNALSQAGFIRSCLTRRHSTLRKTGRA